MNKIVHATHQGTTNINGFKIRCYNLDNGERVLSREGFLRAIGRTGKPKYKEGIKEENPEVFNLPIFLSASNLKPFISRELIESSQPILFQWGKQQLYGFKADILASVCYVFLDAEKKGVLTKSQQTIAERCHLLIRGFATVGIIALVDEATGYQAVREKDALQLFLQKFLEDERGKWVPTFPPEFFEAIFKMKGWTWEEANGGKKPQVVGHYINNFVYSRLAPKILEELRARNPKDERGNRKGKHPQWINPDFGHPKLKEHLTVLTAFAKASGYNWNNWERMVKRTYPKFESDGSAAQEIEFPDE